MAEEKRKRKERGAKPGVRERMEHGYARAEERNQEVRESLEPLDEGERPLVVTIGAVITALIVASILIGYLSGVEVEGDKPKLAQVLAPTQAIEYVACTGCGHVLRKLPMRMGPSGVSTLSG